VPGDIQIMQDMTNEIADLVMEFGGSMSGEHGDGLARSYLNEKLFGSRIYKAFQDVKLAFDPEGRMNPGKIVNAPSMTENLRYGGQYESIHIPTHYDFTREGGFANAIEMCNGAGVCRKQNEGTMCPSYMVTMEDSHSTRGRGNHLRGIISGKIPAEEFTGKALHDTLDLCLECKGCKAECPSNVDMAKLKYEFLAHYNDANGLPLRSNIFAHIHTLSRMASYMPSLANSMMGRPAVRRALDRYGARCLRSRSRLSKPGSANTNRRWAERIRGTSCYSTTRLSISTIPMSELPPQCFSKQPAIMWKSRNVSAADGR
jgi:NAD-dependent dihydropyrimidine dehydrogenase PreA subunit